MEQQDEKFFGKKVSSKKKKIITGVVLAIVFFWIIGSIGGSSSSTSNGPTKVGEVASTQQKQEEAQPEIFKVGDQVKRGDTVLTVTKVNKNWRSSNQFDKPQSTDNTYVVVTMSIENQGSKEIDLNSLFDFKLEDANGVKRSQALGGIGINKLPTGSLSPQGKATGDLIFEAGKDATTNLKLHYEPLFSFGKPAVIELQ